MQISSNGYQKFLFQIANSLAIVFLLAACSPSEPAIYQLKSGNKELTDFHLVGHQSVTREGLTTATFEFQTPAENQLTLTLVMKKAVPPEFQGGQFSTLTDHVHRTGKLSSVNFRYLGGQGDGISIGGDFKFDIEGVEYLFHLPLIQLDTFSY